MEFNSLYYVDYEDKIIRSLFDYDKLYLLVKELKYYNFSMKEKGLIFQSLVDYYDRYDEIANVDQLKSEIAGGYKDSDDLVSIFAILDNIYKIPLPTWNFISVKISEYVKILIFIKVLLYGHQGINSKGFDATYNFVLHEIRKINLIDRVANSSFLEASEKDIEEVLSDNNVYCCPTNIKALDEVISGLYRKSLNLLIAFTGVGKSWYSTHIAKTGILYGKYVLYFTLEMTKTEILKRLYQSISGTTNKKEVTTVSKWNDDFSDMYEEQVDSVHNTSLVHKKLQSLKRFNGELQILEYPSGSITVDDVETKIIEFDNFHSKLPDIIIVDSLSDFKKNRGRELRFDLSDTAKELKRIASSYDCAVVVTQQSNREGKKKQWIDEQSAGESFSPIQVSDTVTTLNQNNKEYHNNQMRMEILKNRSSKKGVKILLYQNLSIGQFCQHSQSLDFESNE